MSTQVFEWLASWAATAPDRIAVELDEGEGNERARLSYADLEARARAVSAELRARGLVAGDRIMLLAANDLGFVTTFFGAMHAGVVVVPTPTASAPEEIRFRVQHAGIRLVVTDAPHHALVVHALASTDTPVVLGSEFRADPDGDDRRAAPLSADALALLLYTSGTTGTAKAACITHGSLVAHTSAIVRRVLELGPEDAVLGTIPLTHSYGLRMALLAPIAAGARTILLRKFDSGRVHALLRDGAITWFPGVPTMFSALARSPDGAHADPPSRSRLGACLSAGAPLAASVRARAEAALGAPIFEGYGLTEATFSTIDDAESGGVRETVGRPVPGVEVRIVDDTGRTLAAGATGEVVVRGPNVMRGYLDDPAATAAAIRDGWLFTGDIGSLDAKGRLRVSDRKKDLIVRGGFNVVPAEVEAALVAHADVDGALVVGIPDEHQGEEVAAVLTLRRQGDLDIASLLAHLGERLATTKWPRYYAVAETLPLGPSGKALRRTVRDRIAAGELRLAPLVTPRSAI